MVEKVGKRQKYQFVVERDTVVERFVEQAARRAIAMVWEHHVGKPTVFRLRFGERFVTEGGTPCEEFSLYDRDTDSIAFALRRIEEQFSPHGLDEEDGVVLFGAHEARHMVQFYQGANPMSPEAEREAWEDAMHVYKKIFPNAQGYLTFDNDTTYVIPEVSKYE